ncbi:hypothetical protein CDAR_174251 [Caerostris darwini]|uniref:Uncharacterized protein n=1 Tax=Caerostris darwini TaxID=1538125 RepID=A0AAV4VIJ3_9ARAC|nr:hypothetical protein CDAR_174251 [Caerostris darwini]
MCLLFVFDTVTGAVSFSVPSQRAFPFSTQTRYKRRESLPAALNLAQEQKIERFSDIYETTTNSVIALQENSSRNYSIPTLCPVMSYFWKEN